MKESGSYYQQDAAPGLDACGRFAAVDAGLYCGHLDCTADCTAGASWVIWSGKSAEAEITRVIHSSSGGSKVAG